MYDHPFENQYVDSALVYTNLFITCLSRIYF